MPEVDARLTHRGSGVDQTRPTVLVDVGRRKPNEPQSVGVSETIVDPRVGFGDQALVELSLAHHGELSSPVAKVEILTGDAYSADVKIKKGGIVCIEFGDAPKAGAGTLRWLFTPNVLRNIAVS